MCIGDVVRYLVTEESIKCSCSVADGGRVGHGSCSQEVLPNPLGESEA